MYFSNSSCRGAFFQFQTRFFYFCVFIVFLLHSCRDTKTNHESVKFYTTMGKVRLSYRYEFMIGFYISCFCVSFFLVFSAISLTIRPYCQANEAVLCRRLSYSCLLWLASLHVLALCVSLFRIVLSCWTAVRTYEQGKAFYHVIREIYTVSYVLLSTTTKCMYIPTALL